MPPTRTTPTVPKKTERTHEENQERAYIAASRRSDRSIEARIESARRASEIHKKRTGRALRITEQDVINEEMYEEEDDDMPMHYRLLQHRLRTDSAEFNSRYLAYMTTQLAQRTQLDNQFSQIFPNYNNVVNGGLDNSMFFGAPPAELQSLVQQQPQSVTSPTMKNLTRPGAPYTVPPRRTSNKSTSNYSVPQSPRSAQTSSSMQLEINSPHLSDRTESPAMTHAGSPLLPHTQTQSNASAGTTFHSFPYRPPYAIPDQHGQTYGNSGPFSSRLPPNAQQFINPLLDPNDSFSASLLGGQQGTETPLFGGNYSLFEGSESVYPTQNDATLAASPSAVSETGEKLRDGSHLDSIVARDDEQDQEESWSTFMTEWESVGGSQG